MHPSPPDSAASLLLPVVRPATLADQEILVRLEQRCFEQGRFSRQSLRYLLTHAHASTLLCTVDGRAAGYVTLLFRRCTPIARIYSIARDPNFRGCRIGDALLDAAEQCALEHGCGVLRLEVRTDNAASIAMFRRRGYQQFGEFAAYYEDRQDALGFQKCLAA